ncbi:uncharacterized protein [Blastocystis hominis]|uniref:Uncharacterized protein n=1 Tax=Blastocystis hominis TaxID=12968 RepID=D8M344_BLAHO|nr:uncharacterized protein [Blastocystis hominis]CBK22767.2 unnamed protein product [Blastocystis hominis]|eukprot:XP_012896815.1 uncharacterized protein [Blastocystis hominis]
MQLSPFLGIPQFDRNFPNCPFTILFLSAGSRIVRLVFTFYEFRSSIFLFRWMDREKGKLCELVFGR